MVYGKQAKQRALEGVSCVKQPIVGYHQDEEGHWVAELRCGHGQHVRHEPPWQVREWVISSAGRAARLGVEVDCVRCDQENGR